MGSFFTFYRKAITNNRTISFNEQGGTMMSILKELRELTNIHQDVYEFLSVDVYLTENGNLKRNAYRRIIDQRTFINKDGYPVVKPVSSDGFVIVCPYCHEIHHHGDNGWIAFGHRQSHCKIRYPDNKGYFITRVSYEEYELERLDLKKVKKNYFCVYDWLGGDWFPSPAEYDINALLSGGLKFSPSTGEFFFPLDARTNNEVKEECIRKSAQNKVVWDEEIKTIKKELCIF